MTCSPLPIAHSPQKQKQAELLQDALVHKLDWLTYRINFVGEDCEQYMAYIWGLIVKAV